MRAHVIAIRPHGGMRIIDEIHRIGHKVVEIVIPGRVRGRGDSDALMRVVGVADRDGKLRNHPTAGEDIVGDNRITVIMDCASAAQGLEQRVASRRTVLQCTSRFVEHRETRVVPLHVLRRADAAIHVRRIAANDESGEAHPDAIKTETGR